MLLTRYFHQNTPYYLTIFQQLPNLQCIQLLQAFQQLLVEIQSQQKHPLLPMRTQEMIQLLLQAQQVLQA